MFLYPFTGVFFVAYFVLILTCGFPLLYMEMVLGQYARSSYIKAWNVIPIFKGWFISVHICDLKHLGHFSGVPSCNINKQNRLFNDRTKLLQDCTLYISKTESLC